MSKRVTGSVVVYVPSGCLTETGIRCPECGESWDPETPGYVEAAVVLSFSEGTRCVACVAEPAARPRVVRPSRLYAAECLGHPDDDYSIRAGMPMGQTHYCDGSCREGER